VSAWRHARAIALLPGTAAVVVPAIVLLAGEGPNLGWGLPGVGAALVVLIGVVLIAVGLALWVWTVRLFGRIGEGTLAPWDPTRHLVVEGPYSHVRNPMITAVLAFLLGEAVLFGSPALLIWCAAFFAINWAWFALYEEPGLERRFGDEYLAYRRNVPRWIPRRFAWTPGRRTVLAFNDAITNRDLAALGTLMTEDHTFIDSDGHVISGRDDVLDAWRGFFEAFPDYRNVWASLTLKGDLLIALGHSLCPIEPRLDGPAIWTAKVRGARVSEWRVYEDTPESRAMLGLAIL
jgi:protein-S-isoprenylcysteine O-methyltransferase Ste14/ketosteroid isomerase-like protein